MLCPRSRSFARSSRVCLSPLRYSTICSTISVRGATKQISRTRTCVSPFTSSGLLRKLAAAAPKASRKEYLRRSLFSLPPPSSQHPRFCAVRPKILQGRVMASRLFCANSCYLSTKSSSAASAISASQRSRQGSAFASGLQQCAQSVRSSLQRLREALTGF